MLVSLVVPDDGSSGNISYRTVDGTAEAGEDYEARQGTLRLGRPSGNNGRRLIQPIEIDTIADYDSESFETLELEFKILSGNLVYPGAANGTWRWVIGIGDNGIHKAPISVEPASVTVAEADSATVTVSIPDNAPNGSVKYRTVNATATAGSDFTSQEGTLYLGTGTTPEGNVRARSQTVSIPTVRDFAVEQTERFYLEFYDASGRLELPGAEPTQSTTVDISDRPVPITVNVGDGSFVNGDTGEEKWSTRAGNRRTNGRIKFVVTIPAGVNLGGLGAAINYRIVPISADPADYQVSYTSGSRLTRATSGELLFIPGRTQQTLWVDPVDDNLVELSETFALELSNPRINGAASDDLVFPDLDRDGVLDDDITVVGTIYSDDLVRVTFDNDTAEEGETLTMGIKLARALNEGETALLSAYRSSARCNSRTNPSVPIATSGLDYQTIIPESFRFEEGDQNKIFSIPVFDDILDEPLECVRVLFRNAGGLDARTVFDEDVNAEGQTGVGFGDGVVAKAFIIDTDPPPVISISRPAVDERSDGHTTALQYRVMLNSPSGKTVTVDYAEASVNGQSNPATAGSDYTALTAGTLTFRPGEVEKSVDVTVKGDYDEEPDETVSVQFSNPVNACIEVSGTCPGTNSVTVHGVIYNDDRELGMAFTLDDPTIPEGDDAILRLTLSRPIEYELRARVLTTAGTATKGTDFGDSSNLNGYTITVPEGGTESTLSVPVHLDETSGEGLETFSFSLAESDLIDGGRRVTDPNKQKELFGSDITIAAIRSRAPMPTASIVDGPALSVEPVKATVTEGWPAAFRVTLAPAASTDVTFTYKTRDGGSDTDGAHTAEAGEDYTATAAVSVTIPAGETSVTLPAIPTLQDTVDEPLQQFSLVLESITGAAADDVQAIQTIRDDDPRPQMSITDATGMEGSELNFTISLSHPSEKSVSVQWLTEDGTARSIDGDYAGVERRRTITFAPGEQSKTVRVQTLEDTRPETTEQFKIQLAHAPHAKFRDPTATGSILDNDGKEISIADAAPVVEAPGAQLNFTVTLTPVQTEPVTIQWKTSNDLGDGQYIARSGGNASIGRNDFTAVSSSDLTFAPGETEKTVSVAILDDDRAENSETIQVVVSGDAASLRFVKARAIGQIEDDDAWNFELYKSLPEAIAEKSGENQEFSLHLKRDPRSDDERNTILQTDSLRMIACRLDTTDLRGTSLPPDFLPSEAAADDFQYGIAPGAGYSEERFTPSGVHRWSSWPCSDRVGELASAAPIIFVPSEDDDFPFFVRIIGDTRQEENERLSIWLQPLSGDWSAMSPERRHGWLINAVIVDDDTPQASVKDIDVDEDVGQASLNVALSQASTHEVQVSYETREGTAISGQDYTTLTGTLTFKPGETVKTITVPIIKDRLVEPQFETFTVALTNPTDGRLNVHPVDGEATVTIADTSLPTLTIPDRVVDEGDAVNLLFNYSDPIPQGLMQANQITYHDSTSGSAHPATEHIDYQEIDGTLSSNIIRIQSGDTHHTRRISTIEDSEIETDEDIGISVSFVLPPPSWAPVYEGNPGNTRGRSRLPTVTIRDDDQASLSMGGYSDGTVRAGRAWTSAAPKVSGRPLGHVTWTVEGDDSDDFTIDPDTGLLTLPPQSFDSPADKDGNNVYVVTARATDEDGNTGTQAVQVSVNAWDLVISKNALAVVESAGMAGYTVALDAQPAGNVTVALTTQGDTAAVSLDKTELTFAPSDWNQPQTVTVTGVDDNTVNLGGRRAVTVVNTAGGSGFVASREYNVAVTVIDDDASVLSITDATVDEGGKAQFTINMSKSVKQAVTVKWQTAVDAEGANPATAGTDYTPVTPARTATIAAATTSVTVEVQTSDDADIEADETFLVVLSEPANAELPTALRTATGTITNNDMTGLFTIEGLGDHEVPENEEWSGSPSVFGNPEGAVTWALEGDDAALFTINKTGDGNADLTLPAQDYENPTDKNQDNVYLVTVRATDTNGNDATADAKITVTDFIQARVLITPPTGPVAEGGTVSFILAFLGLRDEFGRRTVKEDFSLRWSTAADTVGDHPADSSDYTAASQTLTWPAGFGPAQAFKTIEVQTTQDTVDEYAETFLVELTDGMFGTSDEVQYVISGGSSDAVTIGSGKAQIAVTITDDDAQTATVSVANADNATEGDDPEATTDLSFPVTLSAVSGKDVTVGYTLGGTATGGDDYAAPDPLTLTVPAGERTANIVIPVKGDLVQEPDETVTVTLTKATNATLSATQTDLTATGTITDDDLPMLSVEAVTVAEGAAAELTVSLDAAPFRDVTVDWNTTAGTGSSPATADVDYTASATAQTLTIPAGRRSVTVEVQTSQDAVDEPDETFLVELSAPANATLDASKSSAVVTITDDDDPPVLSVAPVTVVEGAAAELTVTLDAVSGRDVTVNWNTAAGSGSNPATVAVDYTAVTSTTVTIPAGSTTATVEVSTVQDTVDEPAETFLVVLSTPVNATLDASKSSAVVTVTDDDDPPVLSVAAVTVVEGAAAELTVTLDAVSGRDVTVNWNTAAGSGSNQATAAVDYTAVTSTTVTIPAGSMSATVEVSTVQDTVDEPAETFLVVLSTPVNATLDASKSSAVVTVTDDDDPPVLSVAAVTVVEGAAAELTVSLDAVSGRDVTVDWNTAAGSGSNQATAAVDYTAVTSTGVTIPAGSMSATVEVSTVQDTVDEPAETFLVVLSTPVNATLDASKSSAVVTVTDDDDPPVLSIAPVTVVEGAAAELTVTLDAVSGRDVTVNWNTAADTEGTNPATVAVDYTAVTSTGVTIPAGTMSATVEVSTVQDTVDEPAETFLVVLSGPVNATLDASKSSAVVTVTDDDDPPVLSVAAVTVVEGTAAELTVTLDAVSGRDVTVDWNTAAGSGSNLATAAVDYTAVTSTTVTIPAGSMSATVEVSTVQDTVDEPAETFLVVLSTPVNATLDASKSSAVVTVTDDDDPPVLSVAPATVVEGAAAELTVSLDAVSGRDVTVNWNTAAGSGSNQATAAVDYTAVTSTGVTIPAGSMSATVEVSTVQDTVDEPAETFLVVLSTPVNATLDASKSSAVVTVTDDDDPPVLSIAPATVVEGTAAELTVTLDAVSGRDVTVNWSTAADTEGTNPATVAVDYTAVASTGVTIPAGTMSATVEVSTVQDTVDEPAETFLVVLSGPVNATLDATKSSSAVTVTDDDATPTGVVLAVDVATVAEDADPVPTVTVTATLAGSVTFPVDQTVTVTVGANSDTATSADYAAVTAFDVVIDAGSLSGEGSFVLTPVDDALDEAVEAVSVTGTATGGLTVTDTQITITDDDDPPVLSIAAATVVEGAAAELTVTLDAVSGRDVTVNWNTAADTSGSNPATVAVDYTAVASTGVTIPAGDTSATVEVSTVQDTVDEPAETFLVVLSGPVNATLDASQSSAVVTVTDDDATPTGVVLSVDVATVAEDVASDGGTAPTVTVTAVLAGSVTFPVDQTVTVTVGANSDTATSADYAAVTAFDVVITAGTSTGSGSFVLSPVDDVLDEAVEAVSVTGTATGGLTVTDTQITITDDDDPPVLSIAAVTVVEGAAAELTVTLDAVSGRAVTVNWSTAADTEATNPATVAVDYTAVASTGVTIPAGTMSATVEVSTVQDTVDEPAETFLVVLSTPVNATLDATKSSATVTVTDDDATPSGVVLAVDVVTVAEDADPAPTVTVTATLAGSVTFPVDQTVTVTVGANSDTATSADYAAVTAFDVVITAGTSTGSGSFVLSPVDDVLDEAVEAVSVTGTATGGLTVTDTQIVITDDDDPPVLSVAAVTVVEGAAAELTVSLDAVSGRDVTVNWSTAADTEGTNQATAAVDYTAVASTGVTIPAGTMSATVEVRTSQDTVDEPAETFLVVLSTPVNATLDATKSSATVTVTDDDATPSGVVLSVDVATVAEDADPAPTVTVTATLAGSVTFPVDQTVTVTVGANSDTATSADYAAVTAFDVVITAGTSSGSGSFVLSPVDDVLDEAVEAVTVTGTATGGLTVTDTQITITDDDDPPVLSVAAVTVVEGTAAELTVTLDAVSGRDVTVNWNTAADTSGSNPATVAVDYTAVASTGVTIPAGTMSATVEVSTVQDTVDEPAETFLVVLSTPINATLDATKSSATVTVTDDDATPSSVVLSVDVATVAEDADPAPTVTVTATLAGSVTFPVDQTVTVTVGKNGDTATSADYAAVTVFDVVITAGTSSGSGSFVLAPVDDALDEPSETLSVTGTATGGLTVTDTQITITDDDDPPVLSIAAVTVVEGTAAELTVTLDAVSGRDVTVNWNTAADTSGSNQATVAVDYTAVASTGVTIPAGTMSATVEVSTVQDTVDEPAETFLVVLSTPVNATLDATKSSATVTVTDDDATPSGVVLTVDVVTVAEDADPAPTVTVTATLAGSVTFPVDQTVTVTVGANSDTATSADYAAVTAFDVVITAGTSTGSGSFVLSPVDDVLDEAVEVLTVTGTATGGLTVTDTQITITDDDDPPVLSIAAVTVVEGTAAELTVTLDAVSGRDVSVSWSTGSGGTDRATADVDYTAVATARSVTVPAGDTTATVEVPTTQDMVDEPAETFVVVLSAPVNATLDASQSSATVTITDDDATPSSVVLSVDVATVAEDADPAPTVTVTATLAGSVTFAAAKTVEVTVGEASDTATASVDYTAVAAFDVVIDAGSLSGSGSFVLTPVDDVLDEAVEAVSVTGTATGGLTVTDTQITITDDDDPPVLSIAAVTVTEGTAAELTVTLDAVSGRDVTVNWNTAAGSGSNPATVAVDYTAVASTGVTIPAGTMSATVEVSTVQDTVDEPAETFLVVLSTPTNATLDATKSSATVTVTDDDATPSSVVLTVDVATVAEDADPAPTVTVTATLAGSVTFTVDQTVTVTVGANSDTATAVDYAAVTAFDVVITAGTSTGSGSFVLTPVDDVLDEPSETLSVTGTATGGLTVTDTQITITDDDDPPVLSVAAVTVVEGAAAELTVSLDAVSGRDVTVNWNTAVGSGSNPATVAVDYTAVTSTTVTIPAGDTTATVEVSTVQDTVENPLRLSWSCCRHRSTPRWTRRSRRRR